ncbi:NAD(P)-dependent oxidoreductase [Microbacterium allomyrinae]|uniref:NAD(P)-dependent oxidoreductase n=1 Tax=Microbacterium allomyrinae TaxID=2830666 RepID=A0A9X1S2B6_9MICO|nr:NAD(P)-dependent oxidoreductase [Microbacterium allomyrinae]MCC2030718.1 NAD(P)-dependent oxidoreductase [Microbacterium allomyrinae]
MSIIDDDDTTIDPARSLGCIGLGAMGEPMAKRLLAAHGSLVITGRRRRPALEAAGATWVANPRELAAHADAVLVMLPDLPELEELLHGPDGLLAGGGDLLVMIGSTSSATAVRELADRLHTETAGRVRVVDCPVSGGVDGAMAGTLSIMLGGDPDDTARAAAILEPCGTPVQLGPLGAGEVAKACNQLVVAATILALGEATVLAERSGIDPRALWDLLGGGYAGSNLLASRKEKLVTGDDAPSGIARYMLKDLRFAADVAAATGTHPALLPALREAFDEIVDAGLGDRDIAVTRRFIAERAASDPQAAT